MNAPVTLARKHGYWEGNCFGNSVGLSGQEVIAWEHSERAEQRPARAAEREASREAAEREKKGTEMAKEAAEREKEAADRAKEAAEREKVQLLLRISLQEGGANPSNAVARKEALAATSAINPLKLLPLFDEKRDDLHAYLQRWERVAKGQQWPQDKWALPVSMCLSGEALTNIGRMTAEESLDYGNVKRRWFSGSGLQPKAIRKNSGKRRRRMVKQENNLQRDSPVILTIR